MQLLADEPTVWRFPSCEPGRFKRCKLDVVRWWKRTPTRTKPITVPADLKLAILSRGRVRLPFRSIKWLLDLGRRTRNPHMAWARRLPPNFELTTILAEVDVTVELFVILPRLRTSTVNYILGRYLKQRHATETPNCPTRFLYTWDSATSKPVLENRLSEGCPTRLSLGSIFSKAQVKMPSAMDALERRSFILVVYASFPDEIDLHLRPRPPSGGTPRERMYGHLQRVHEEMVPLDEEDDEVLCLVERLLNDDANDEFTTRHTAEAYSEGRLDHFRSSMRTALTTRVGGWKGTNVNRFIDALRDLNRKAQTGLNMVDYLATDDISHEWATAREMWAWRNARFADPGSLMNCYQFKVK